MKLQGEGKSLTAISYCIREAGFSSGKFSGGDKLHSGGEVENETAFSDQALIQ